MEIYKQTFLIYEVGLENNEIDFYDFSGWQLWLKISW